MTPFEIIAQTTQAISSNPNDAEAYKQRALTLRTPEKEMPPVLLRDACGVNFTTS